MYDLILVPIMNNAQSEAEFMCVCYYTIAGRTETISKAHKCSGIHTNLSAISCNIVR